MSNPFRRLAGVFACTLAASALFHSFKVSAVDLTLTDPCAGSIAATGATTSVDANGNLSISGASAPYAVLFGCEPVPPATPSCTLSASQTRVAPNVATTLFAKCWSTPTSYAWNAPSEATVYGSKDGYVVVNDRTGEVVQVSDRRPGSGWVPDSRIKWGQ